MSAASTPITILITGANRGIGLGLVELYAKQPNTRVIGTARDTKGADKLNALTKTHKNVSVVALDVSDSKSVAALPAALAALQPAVKALDVLINNAGVLSGVKGHDGFSPLEGETVANFANIYRTNVIGVFEVTQVLLPLIRAAPSKAAKIVNISSVAGQMVFTTDGPLPGLGAAYRASKAALNQLTAVQAREYNHATVTAAAAAAAAPGDAKLAAAAAAAAPVITVVTLHPGVVDTPLFDQTKLVLPGARTVVDSADGIAKIIAGAKPEPKAKFYDAIEQKELPW